MFDDFISNNKDNIINTLCNTIKYPSISIENDGNINPFGQDCTDVLNYILDIAKSMGFRTKNLSNYCGYVEFGDGDELIGIIGHLDVVPADDTWKYSPFNPVIENGKIFGRGAIDDKGPVIASLYAMKAVMDATKANKRVRLILGLNEEKSWKCINYYKKHEESPTISFSPDANFPCIYAEKGILTVYLKQHLSVKSDICISHIDCNNNAINVVPKYCKIILKVSERLNNSEIISKLNNIISKYGFDIRTTNVDSTHISITSHGVAAHSAHPELGLNAISRILIVIADLLNEYYESIPLLNIFCKYIGTEFDGHNLGINFSDESGDLTLNVGNLKLDDDFLKIGINLRIPVSIPIDRIKDKFQDLANSYDNIFASFPGVKAPLYIDKNNKLVTTLCNVFNTITGRHDKPIAIGGATYARAFDNCISFGATMPGDADMCHQADEYIKIDDLLTSTKIYATAIYELLKIN